MISFYETASKQFLERGYCILDIKAPFLKHLNEVADDLELATEADWTYVIRHNDFEGDLPLSTDKKILFSHRQKAYKENSQGLFSFFFQRMTTAHGLPLLTVPKALISSRDLMESRGVRNLLESVSGRSVGNIEQLYINKFTIGDFLGVHRDGGNNLSVALNLTNNWLTMNGGQTHIVDDTKNIVDSLSPSFGKLLIIDSMKKNAPHFVSTVTSTNDSPRVAIITRYN